MAPRCSRGFARGPIHLVAHLVVVSAERVVRDAGAAAAFEPSTRYEALTLARCNVDAEAGCAGGSTGLPGCDAVILPDVQRMGNGVYACMHGKPLLVVLGGLGAWLAFWLDLAG